MHVVLRPSFAGAIASKEEPALETEHKPLFIHMQENFDEACHYNTRTNSNNRNTRAYHYNIRNYHINSIELKAAELYVLQISV